MRASESDRWLSAREFHHYHPDGDDDDVCSIGHVTFADIRWTDTVSDKKGY